MVMNEYRFQKQCNFFHKNILNFNKLDVRSLAVASRSRQSEKQPIVDELALIEHAHMGRSFRARRTVATCHG